MKSWDLRAARHAQRLTLRQVAVAAGTSVPNVSAYERGTKAPNASTVSRLVAVVEAGHASPIHRHDLVTVPRCAAALRRILRQAEPTTGELLRLVREMISNADEVWDSAPDRAAFFAAPTTTGDMRWDAMLAGVVEMLHLRHDLDPPAWTVGHALDTIWWVGSVEGLHAYAFAHSPPSLHVRGVMIDPTDLEFV
jgi:transcriptional regulator with XRE-family HTH domain